MDWPAWRADLFDPQKVPFSRRGSFLAISWIAGDGAFWLRNLRGGDENTDLGRLLRLEVVDLSGQVVQPAWTLTPDCLMAQAGDGVLRFAFDGPDRIVLAGHGLRLRLRAGESRYSYAQQGADHVHICNARQDLRCNIAASRGAMHLHADWDGVSSSAIWLDLSPDDDGLVAAFDFFRVTPDLRPPLPLTDARRLGATEFVRFQTNLPSLPHSLSAGHLLASYILWSAYVPAEGALGLPAVYMSKNWMTNIWSWDHCFVALGFGQTAPELAFQQMQVIFAAQDASGRLPDYINDRYAYWAFTKPPVHGWTFAQLRAMAPAAYPPERMSQIVVWLEAQVGSWMAGPRWGDLPAYRHGNDAGWDNATCFAEGGPLASPDLATFLILQLDEIAALHRALGESLQAQEATRRAEAMCAALCRDLWDGAGFVARHCDDGRAVGVGQSLLLFLPLLLGDRLPVAMRERLLTGLLQPGRFLTDHGVATEATDSPLYRANGYWRGPIWAPTTALFMDALIRCGHVDSAVDLARRYCAMCNTQGMAENHDALTGQGLHDPAFAWTSATFLRLGHSLLE